MDVKEVRALLRKKVEEAGSTKAAAINLGIGSEYLSSLLTGYSTPGPKVLKKLGLQKVITFERVDTDPPAST